jgi:adenosylcobinamide kinase/adenosylcobinamide-phosphate guanylyltransferase
MRELILGGQKSGKSRAAVERARAWLAAADARHAVLLATAEAGDAEMTTRIERHRLDRAVRVPALRTVEAGGDLQRAIDAHGAADTLLVVDCLTLWLTQRLMPLDGRAAPDLAAQTDTLIDALVRAPGPVVLVSNEIAMGVIAIDRATRGFVDALGLLHQRVAAACERVTLMVAGCELAIKGTR